MLKVAKFGGSSVADAEQFKKVKNIIDSDPARKIVVTSAAGKRYKEDHKLTDLLYLVHAHLNYGVSCDEIIDSIEERFVEIRNDLGLKFDIESEFGKFRKKLSKDFSVDELVSRGEYFTSLLMAEFLGFQFVDAAEVVIFSFDGNIDKKKTYEAIKAAYDKYGKILIPGFYGRLPNGKIKVMSRGGSDISGALAAAAVNADVYENWTDVSGILTADPRIVDNPAPIAYLTYPELKELASMGASVLHEDAVQPVKEAKIPLNIRNTNRPQDDGTMIIEKVDKELVQDRFLTGVAGRKNFSILTIRKHNLTSSSTLIRALEVMDRYHIFVEHITLGVDTFGMVVSTSDLGEYQYDVISDLNDACHPDDIATQDNIALVAAVGRKMTFRPGVSGKIFNALGEHGVNIKTIAQGADELSIIVGVDNKNFDTAIRVLYDGFAG